MSKNKKSNDLDSSKDNVIPFPTRHLRLVNDEEAPKNEKAEPDVVSALQGFRFTQQGRRVAVAASLILVFFVATVSNNIIFQEHAEVAGRSNLNSRSIASINGQAIGQMHLDWEENLAERLSTPTTRGIASLGRHPTIEEKLRFGLLEGKYAVRYENGKVREIEYTHFGEEKSFPKYVNDRVAFIKKYQKLLPVEPKTIVSTGSEIKSNRIHESYNLLNEGKVIVASIKFELDVHGRLLSMKVDKPRLKSN